MRLCVPCTRGTRRKGSQPRAANVFRVVPVPTSPNFMSTGPTAGSLLNADLALRWEVSVYSSQWSLFKLLPCYAATTQPASRASQSPLLHPVRCYRRSHSQNPQPVLSSRQRRILPNSAADTSLGVKHQASLSPLPLPKGFKCTSLQGQFPGICMSYPTASLPLIDA